MRCSYDGPGSEQEKGASSFETRLIAETGSGRSWICTTTTTNNNNNDNHTTTTTTTTTNNTNNTNNNEN